MATIIATSGSTIDASPAEVLGTLSFGAAKRADLRPRACWPVLLIPAFGLILIAALWVVRLHQVEVEQQRTLETAMRHTESTVAAFEQYALRAIRDADRTTLLVKYALERDGVVNLPGMIQKGLIPLDALIQLSVTDASGNVIASSLDARGARNMADREYFRLHSAQDMGRLDIGKPIMGRISGMMSIPFTRRVNHADGSFAGIVILQVDPDYFTDFYKEADLGKLGVLSVLGTDSVFRARRAGNEPASTPETVTPALPQMLANPTGSLETESRIDHIVRLLSYRRLENFPLIVTAARAKSEVLAEFEERRTVYLGLATVASAIILVFFVIVTLLVVRLQRSQRRTWEARQILRAASDSSLDAFFLMRSVRDKAGRIVDFVVRDLNARGAQLVGEARRPLIGRHFRELVPFAKSGDSVDKYTRVVETGEPLDEEFELDTPKAGRRWFRQQVVRVRDGLAITTRDITHRKHNEEAVQAQRSFLQTLIDNIPLGILVRSTKGTDYGKIVLWNETYAMMFGISESEAIGKTVADLLPPASAARIEELDRQLLASPMVQEVNDLIITTNGVQRMTHIIRAPIFDAHDTVEYITTVVRDVTDEQARTNEIRLASKVFETTADAIVLTDAADFVVMVNSAFSKLTGFTPEDMLGRLLSETPFRPVDPVESAARMEHLHREGYVTGEVQRVHWDGSELVLWVTATCSRDNSGKIINYVRVFTDISPLKEAQRKLEQMASYDALTRLPNRRLFQDRLEQALSRASRSNRQVGLMFLDLDGFKDVNDTLGHDVGDQLLCEVADRLRECVRESDSLCRLGGDEFTIIIENAMLPPDAIRAAERMVQALAAPFLLSGHEVKTTASIGIAMYPDDGAESTTLIKNADVAMYRAKQAGRNRFQVFSPVELVKKNAQVSGDRRPNTGASASAAT